MTTINETNSIVTVINVFTVRPEKHQELLDILIEATENVMSRMPGYISANIHTSIDKKTITNYAQWSSLDDFQKMLQHPEAQEHMRKAAVIATEYHPVTYNKIWTHSNRIVRI
jgi:quinol monooxygenase YgiN